jgi:hypothetical protein
MIIKLEKLRESKNPEHPNNIQDGYTHIGHLKETPVVGENFWVGINWRTSTVKKIIDENTFETCNSIYRWSEHKP